VAVVVAVASVAWRHDVVASVGVAAGVVAAGDRAAVVAARPSWRQRRGCGLVKEKLELEPRKQALSDDW